MHIKQNGDGVFMFQIMIFNENINMANGDIKILENLSINQNVICWVLSYIGVAYAEANNLCYLVLRWLVSVLALFHFDNDYIDILHDTLLQEEME